MLLEGVMDFPLRVFAKVVVVKFGSFRQKLSV